MKKSQKSPLVLLIASLLFASACTGMAAKEQLQKRGVEISAQEFVKRAKGGDIDTVRLFIAAGMNSNSKDDAGTTPLMAAAGAGQLDLAKLLVENGGDIRAADNRGNRPIVHALMSKSSLIVDFLIQSGLSVDAPIWTEDTPTMERTKLTMLQMAVLDGDLDTIRVLLKRGASPTLHDPILGAIVHSNLPAMELLLNAGVDPNKHLADAGPALSFVIIGIKDGNIPPDLGIGMIRLLVAKGADVKYKNSSEHWLFSNAVTPSILKNSPEILEILLKHGADPNSEMKIDGNISTALDEAVFLALKDEATIDQGAATKSLDILIENGAILKNEYIKGLIRTAIQFPTSASPFGQAVVRKLRKQVGLPAH